MFYYYFRDWEKKGVDKIEFFFYEVFNIVGEIGL